jgi:hypothetical protein
MDRVDGCKLGTSRRGTYVRKPHHRRVKDGGSSHDGDSQQELDITTLWLDGVGTTSSDTSPTPDQANGTSGPGALVSASKDVVRNYDQRKEDTAALSGIMLFGNQSPLIFALKEADRSRPTDLHEANVALSKSKTSVFSARARHPPHCSKQDLDFLSAKGAFTPPEPGLEKLLVQAFLGRFYPLYSIVDKEAICQLHRKAAIPFILLHAICLIGATFCDISTIHRYGFKSRMQARKDFYEKAKIIFLLDYEQDKFVLLQTVIMLSFSGPHMDSIWNPCSWIDFGVTIASSLGMHLTRCLGHASSRDTGLIKRIWWTLVWRDANCAALVGRPARTDMSQCDTEPLSPCDFPDHGRDQLAHAQYQVSVAKLSLVVRQIIAEHPMGTDDTFRASDLYGMLNQWQAQLPIVVASNLDTTGHSDIFATSLELLYHYHVLLIHLKWPNQELQSSGYDPVFVCSAAGIASASARAIALTAATLVINRDISRYPAEIFPSFLMAGIIFHRQLRQTSSPVAHAARTALNDCQQMVSQVREVFDPACWMIGILDSFLSDEIMESITGNTDLERESLKGTTARILVSDNDLHNSSFDGIVDLPNGACDLFPMNWHTLPDTDALAGDDNIWALPNLESTS